MEKKLIALPEKFEVAFNPIALNAIGLDMLHMVHFRQTVWIASALTLRDAVSGQALTYSVSPRVARSSSFSRRRSAISCVIALNLASIRCMGKDEMKNRS
jgi:hypothetical protein